MRSTLPTPRQLRVFTFIADFCEQNGFAPSYHEIGLGLGLSSLASVHKHVHTLERLGYLAVDPSRARSIVILKRGKQSPVNRRKLIERARLHALQSGNSDAAQVLAEVMA